MAEQVKELAVRKGLGCSVEVFYGQHRSWALLDQRSRRSLLGELSEDRNTRAAGPDFKPPTREHDCLYCLFSCKELSDDAEQSVLRPSRPCDETLALLHRLCHEEVHLWQT